MHHRTGRVLLGVPEKVHIGAKIHIIVGCPVPWVRRQGSGSPLCKSPHPGPAALAQAPGPMPLGLEWSWSWILGLAVGGSAALLKAERVRVRNNPISVGWDVRASVGGTPSPPHRWAGAGGSGEVGLDRSPSSELLG